MHIGIVVHSLPQFDKYPLINKFKEVWNPETANYYNFSESITADFYERGNGDGAIILFPSEYFIEYKERSWLIEYFLGDKQQLNPDINKRVDELIKMYKDVSQFVPIVKIVISDAEKVPVNLLIEIDTLIRQRIKITSDWILKWDQHNHKNFTDNLILHTAAKKNKI